MGKEEKLKALLKKYKIDLKKLEEEQIRLARKLEIKDKIDFSVADRFGGFENTFVKNKIISCIVVCNRQFEIIDQAYVIQRVNFPYIPGFRAYRELPAMVEAFEKLNERPDVVFIPGQGIIHPRLGLASHFGLATATPTIGVSNVVIGCEYENKNGASIKKGEKTVGKVLISKEKSNPLYISPGNYITVSTSYNLTKEMIKPPHKRPEPLHKASKYAKKVKRELAIE